MFKASKKVLLLFSTFLIILVTIGMRFMLSFNNENGTVYESKLTLCQKFAQSYLKTIQKTENITGYESKKWQMAIDVETDLYNLCLVEFNKNSLKDFKLSALEKYKK